MAKHSSLELQLTINTVEGMEILRALDDGPLGLSDLAVRTGVDTFRLIQVARALVFHGILVRRGGGEYARADLLASRPRPDRPPETPAGEQRVATSPSSRVEGVSRWTGLSTQLPTHRLQSFPLTESPG